MGLDLDLHHADVMFPEMRKLQGLEQAVWALQHLFFGALPRAALPDAQELITRWRPDVVLHELSEVAGMLAGERAGLPYVSFHWTGTGVDVLALMLGDAWQELRDLAELPSDPELAALGRWLTIAAMPRSWAEPVTDDRVLRIHLPQFDRRADVEVPDWLDEMQTEPFVYGTLGTMFNDTPGVLDALIAGFGELDINAVVTTGGGVTTATRGRSRVRVEDYVPQSLLLPHATALVHHGGFNTLLGGLNFGLPQVFIPLAADQPILAARGVELGIGVSIEGDDQRSSAAIAAATNHILTEPSYHDAAQRMKTDVTALPGIRPRFKQSSNLSRHNCLCGPRMGFTEVDGDAAYPMAPHAHSRTGQYVCAETARASKEALRWSSLCGR